MAKVKLMQFELISLLSESKKITEYLQKTGAVQFENADDEELIKYKTTGIVAQLEKKLEITKKSYETIEKFCEIKKSLIEKFNDCKEIEYSDYRLLSDKSEELFVTCNQILALYDEIKEKEAEAVRQQTLIDYYMPWSDLDIPMASKRTVTTNIFVGTFRNGYSKDEILSMIKEKDGELDDIEVEVVSTEKMLTCAVLMCHRSSGEALERVLRELGFIIPDKIAAKLPTKAAEDCKAEIEKLQKERITTDIILKSVFSATISRHRLKNIRLLKMQAQPKKPSMSRDIFRLQSVRISSLKLKITIKLIWS